MFYTVKEIAELLEVSKPTVQKIINENFIEADKIEKNKFRYYSYDKVVFIIGKIKPEFDLSILSKSTEKPLKSTEKPQITPQDFSETTDKPQKEETLERMLSIIEQQLEEKNKLLAQKDREIENLQEKHEKERASLQKATADLQDKLAAAYSQISEMAQRAQYITAADKTAQIMDKQKEENPAASSDVSIESGEPKAQKKGFFTKLFKR